MRPFEHLFNIALWSLTGLLFCVSCAHADDGRGERPDEAPQLRTIERDAERGADSDEAEDLSVDELEARAKERELADTDYPYHDHPREIGGELNCPDIETAEYEGEAISYNRPIEINPAFRKRLVRFERLVGEVATEVYGRAPDEIVHRGGHTCRSVGGKKEKLSEHTFGHAIDVAGFTFEVASDGDEVHVEEAKEAFEVRVEDHWGADGGFTGKHSEFLRELADALERRGPFSTMLGPSYAGHDALFHLDFGPQFFFRL